MYVSVRPDFVLFDHQRLASYLFVPLTDVFNCVLQSKHICRAFIPLKRPDYSEETFHVIVPVPAREWQAHTTGKDVHKGKTLFLQIVCKSVTRRCQNTVRSRCRKRVGGSERLGKGSIVVGWQEYSWLEQEAWWQAAIASCLPRERCLRSKRWEDGGRRKPVEESQLERANRRTPAWQWERERED